MTDAVIVAAALHGIAVELHLIRLCLFALCPEADQEALMEAIEAADAKHAQGLEEIAKCHKK